MVSQINNDKANDAPTPVQVVPPNNSSTNPYGIFYNPMQHRDSKINDNKVICTPTPAPVIPSSASPTNPYGIFYNSVKQDDKKVNSEKSNGMQVRVPMLPPNDSSTHSYGIFYDSEKYERNKFKLLETKYSSSPDIKEERWINDSGSSKYTMYCNNIPVQVTMYRDGNDRRKSLIKDDLQNFVKNNINKENINEFLSYYGKNEFIKDIFNNSNLDWDAKNSVYNTVVSMADSQNKDVLADAKNRLVMDGDFEGSFYQGHTGDCVVIGRLLAIISKPKGKALLKSLVRIDDNGNMIIKFAGLNKEVTVTYADLNDKKYNNLSEDNADIKAIEIAWQKLTKYVGGLNNPLSNMAFDRALLGASISINEISNVEYLVPFPTLVKQSLKKHFKEEFNNPDKAYVLALNAFNFIFRIGVNITEEGNEFRRHKIQPAHQFAITKADDDYVYIQDPGDGPENYKLKWSDFNRLSFMLHEMQFNSPESIITQNEVNEILTDQCFL